MLYLLDSAGGAVAPTYEVRFVPKEAVTHHLDQKSTLQDRYVSYKVGIVLTHNMYLATYKRERVTCFIDMLVSTYVEK